MDSLPLYGITLVYLSILNSFHARPHLSYYICRFLQLCNSLAPPNVPLRSCRAISIRYGLSSLMIIGPFQLTHTPSVADAATGASASPLHKSAGCQHSQALWCFMRAAVNRHLRVNKDMGNDSWAC